MRVYAAMAQKERELINDRTRPALGAVKVRMAALGGDRGYGPLRAPDACAATAAREEEAARTTNAL